MKKSFLNSRAIQNLQYTLLSWLNWELPETLSPDVLKRIHMMSMTEAMRNIHFPESAAKLRDAQLRLKFDELFFIQLKHLSKTITLLNSISILLSVERQGDFYLIPPVVHLGVESAGAFRSVFIAHHDIGHL